MTKLLGWMVLVLVPGGCTAEDLSAGPPLFCVVDADCPDALICTEGACVTYQDPGAGGAAGAAGGAAPDPLPAAPDAAPQPAAGAGAPETVEGDEEPAGPVEEGLVEDTEDEPLDPPQAPTADDDPPDESRCQQTETSVVCTRNQDTFMNRLVVWQTPLGEAPGPGWPAVVVFQGSFYGPDVTWEGDDTLPFGAINQIRTQAQLLDQGFTVIAPAADGVAWATNFPAYEASSDAQFIPALLEAMAQGRYGPIDMDRLYATGISSGGYMTSRMAVSYPGRFRALAINSGSYATCTNVLCSIPPLPADHPPTLFLHGQNDIAVPVGTMQMYEQALRNMGVETRVVIDPLVMHQWLKVAPEEIPAWFATH